MGLADLVLGRRLSLRLQLVVGRVLIGAGTGRAVAALLQCALQGALRGAVRHDLQRARRAVSRVLVARQVSPGSCRAWPRGAAQALAVWSRGLRLADGEAGLCQARALLGGAPLLLGGAGEAGPRDPVLQEPPAAGTFPEA